MLRPNQLINIADAYKNLAEAVDRLGKASALINPNDFDGTLSNRFGSMRSKFLEAALMIIEEADTLKEIKISESQGE